MSDNYVVPVPWEKPYIPPGMNPSTSRGYYTGPRRTSFGPMNPSTQDGYYTGPRPVSTTVRPTVGPSIPVRTGGAARYNPMTPSTQIVDWADQVLGTGDTGDMTYNDLIESLFGSGPTGGGSGGGGPSRQQIADAITRMTNAARGAQTEIGKAYDVAGSKLDQLMQQYAAAASAQRAGAGQTLQAFGVDPSQLDVGGMSPQDLLVAQRANVAMQKAAQDAAIADRIAAYQTLLGA